MRSLLGIEWWVWAGGFTLLCIGIVAGYLFAVRVIVPSNAYDDRVYYTTTANGENISCLSLSSIKQICGMSRELLEYQHTIDVRKCLNGTLGDAR